MWCPRFDCSPKSQITDTINLQHQPPSAPTRAAWLLMKKFRCWPRRFTYGRAHSPATYRPLRGHLDSGKNTNHSCSRNSARSGRRREVSAERFGYLRRVQSPAQRAEQSTRTITEHEARDKQRARRYAFKRPPTSGTRGEAQGCRRPDFGSRPDACRQCRPDCAGRGDTRRGSGAAADNQSGST